MALKKLDYVDSFPETQKDNPSDHYTFKYRLRFAKDILAFSFGIEWLENRLTSRSKKTTFHPIQLLWRELCMLDKPHLKQVEIDSARYLEKLGYIAAPLSYGSLLEGFKECVLPRLKNIDFFDPALFEVFVASKFKAEGSSVKFISPVDGLNQKTPDLLVRRYGFNMYVECKKKMTYHKVEIANKDLRSAIDFVESLETVPDGFHIKFLCLASFELRNFRLACLEALEFANKGDEGVYYDHSTGMGVNVEKVSLLAAVDSGLVYNWSCEKNGISSRFSIVALESNRPQNLIDSLKAGSKQLDKNETNIIAIQTSLLGRNGGFSRNEVVFYFACLKSAIANYWNNNQNSRVKGIMLIQGPYSYMHHDGNYTFRKSRIYSLLIPNPNFQFETAATLEGESQLYNPFRIRKSTD